MAKLYLNVRALLFLAAGVLFIGAVPHAVFASTTNGTIDSTYKYAWGGQTGWFNFGTTGGNIHITDTALTGYIWSENYGWINVAPAGSGVTNNGEGALAGSAWGENLGYVNFSGVTINSSGKFTGSAAGTVAGTINFDCTNCNVQTDWRPASTRNGGASPSPSSGGGGAGGPLAEFLTPPQEPLALIINNGRVFTTSNIVGLFLIAGNDVKTMAISNRADLSDASQQPFAATALWDLCSRAGTSLGACPEGTHTVYAKLYTQWGQSKIVSSTITYKENLTAAEATQRKLPPIAVAGGATHPSFFSQLKELLLGIIPEFLKPNAISPTPPVAVVVPKIPQLTLNGQWELLPVEAIHEFVFAPLPAEIAVFTAKFPSFKKTFEEAGVTRQSDVQKLLNITLIVPGVGETVGIAQPGPLAFPNAVPLALLSDAARQKLPTETLFVQSIGEKFDINVNVRLAENGVLESYVNTIVGSPLHLVVKPDGHPARVLGYLIFDSRTTGNNKKVSVIPQTLGMRMYRTMPAGQLAAVSETMYRNAFGAPAPAPQGNRLSLLEFEYADVNRDGIYTADIMAPVVDGTYEIITRANYADGATVTTKEYKLIAVVDPEGYVYEASGGRETRIPDAIVTLYWKNPQSGALGAWPAEQYNQRNPQVTDTRGTYAFLAPEGEYYIRVDASGYTPYRGENFELRAGSSGVHVNIEMIPRWGFLSQIDWKTVLLIIVILLLAYNFYRDRMRMQITQGVGQGA